MQFFHSAFVLLIISVNYSQQQQITMEDRINVLETKILVGPWKNRQDIEKLYELIQDMKSGEQKPFEAGELPDVGKRLGDMQRTIDAFMKEVKDELHTMRKGLSEEKSLLRLVLDSFETKLTDNAFGLKKFEKKTESLRDFMSKHETSIKAINATTTLIQDEMLLNDARMTNFEQQLDDVRNEIFPCPKDWFQIKNTCYLYVTDTRKSWHDANLACKEFGGKLAEPNDAETLDALIEVNKGSTWVGATDEATEGSWVWSGSKTPVTYFKWRKDQPNNFRGQDCLEIWDYGYNDIDCTETQHYICEKDIHAI